MYVLKGKAKHSLYEVTENLGNDASDNIHHDVHTFVINDIATCTDLSQKPF